MLVRNAQSGYTLHGRSGKPGSPSKKEKVTPTDVICWGFGYGTRTVKVDVNSILLGTLCSRRLWPSIPIWDYSVGLRNPLTVLIKSMGMGVCSRSCCSTTARTSWVYTDFSWKHRLVAAGGNGRIQFSCPYKYLLTHSLATITISCSWSYP